MMVSPTEGIPLEKCKKVFLRRNHPSEEDLPESAGSPREAANNAIADGACNEENMEVRICVNTYRLFFMQNTEDFIVRTRKERMAMGPEQLERVKEKRKRRWREKILGDAGWMKELEKEEVDRKKEEWDRFLKEGNHSVKDVDMGGI
jgi:paired amphipathic helix protein Sin3a